LGQQSIDRVLNGHPPRRYRHEPAHQAFRIRGPEASADTRWRNGENTRRSPIQNVYLLFVTRKCRGGCKYLWLPAAKFVLQRVVQSLGVWVDSPETVPQEVQFVLESEGRSILSLLHGQRLASPPTTGNETSRRT